MRQTRFYASGAKQPAEMLYAALETAFEEEGAPLAFVEIDERRQIFEVSVYVATETAEADLKRVEAVAACVFASAGASATGGQGSKGGDFALCREDLPEKDWMADVLAALKPVRAGRFLVHGAHDRDKVASNDLSIEIEAGQAFGTGHHGTTAGCLEMIGRLVARRAVRCPIRNALDLGTGSAVLAIGLAKLAKIPVLATDIDPVATRVAAANIRANHAHTFVTAETAIGFASPAILTRAPFDLIVANILAGPLMKLAPQFAANLARGGDIVLSGILATQRDAVLSAFRIQGLTHRRTLTRGEWVTLHLSRKEMPVAR